MRQIWISVALCVAACSSSKSPNELPPETWGADDYTKAGVPASDHQWTAAEHETAAQALTAAAANHREHLPRIGSDRSGLLYLRLLEGPALGGLSAAERFAAHAQRFDAGNRISKLYVKEVMAGANTEYIGLLGSLLREAAALQRDAQAFIESFGPDDPKRANRQAGYAQMRQGWGQMILGALMTLGDLRTPERARVTLAVDLREVLGVIYPTLDAPAQRMVRDQLERMHKLLKDGPVKQALPPLP